MSPFAYGLATLIDDDTILIMGGKQNIISSNKTYIYDMQNDILKHFV